MSDEWTVQGHNLDSDGQSCWDTIKTEDIQEAIDHAKTIRGPVNLYLNNNELAEYITPEDAVRILTRIQSGGPIHTKTTWDDLCETDEERRMLARLRRSKIGQDAESDFGNSDFILESDGFTEIQYRIGYTIGNILDCDDTRFSDSNLNTARRWLKCAEELTGWRPEEGYY